MHKSRSIHNDIVLDLDILMYVWGQVGSIYLHPHFPVRSPPPPPHPLPSRRPFQQYQQKITQMERKINREWRLHLNQNEKTQRERERINVDDDDERTKIARYKMQCYAQSNIITYNSEERSTGTGKWHIWMNLYVLCVRVRVRTYNKSHSEYIHIWKWKARIQERNEKLPNAQYTHTHVLWS